MAEVIIEVDPEAVDIPTDSAEVAADTIDVALDIVEKIEDAKREVKGDDSFLMQRFDSIDEKFNEVINRLISIETMSVITPEIVVEKVEEVIEEVAEEITEEVSAEEVDEDVSDFEEIPDEVEAPILRTKKTRRWL